MYKLIDEIKNLATDYYKETGIEIDNIYFNSLAKTKDNIVYETKIEIMK